MWDLSNGKSPLLTHTQNVTKLLSQRIKDKGIVVKFAMRYQNPSMEKVLDEIQRENFDRIIILPLFPQYASASSGSAIEKAIKIIQSWWVIPELKIINQFWDSEGYVNSIVERSKVFDLNSYDHILFSYHGLPDRHVDKVYDGSDLCMDQPCETEINELNKFCYKATCYATTRLIADKLNLKEGDYTVCFQSRLNKNWLKPFSDKVVEELAKEGAQKLLVFSPAFVADCLETLIEIGVEYQELFEENGGVKVDLVPSSNDHPEFISCLEELIMHSI